MGTQNSARHITYFAAMYDVYPPSVCYIGPRRFSIAVRCGVSLSFIKLFVIYRKSNNQIIDANVTIDAVSCYVANVLSSRHSNSFNFNCLRKTNLVYGAVHCF